MRLASDLFFMFVFMICSFVFYVLEFVELLDSAFVRIGNSMMVRFRHSSILAFWRFGRSAISSMCQSAKSWFCGLSDVPNCSKVEISNVAVWQVGEF